VSEEACGESALKLRRDVSRSGSYLTSEETAGQENWCLEVKGSSTNKRLTSTIGSQNFHVKVHGKHTA
jgi:hypothetical protein